MENQIAILHTNRGNITIELFTEQAPITAGNFSKLIQEGYFDGIKFHRVINDFMIQGGDPLTKDDTKASKWGTGGPGYSIADEFIEGLSNARGSLSMANSGPNTGGSQFFINLKDNSFLDFDKEPLSSKHPVFGKVIEGMDVVDAIAKTQTGSQDRPVDPIVIERAEIKTTAQGV
ncbi:MAG: peptidylprolyl isomerase [bacterium]|nr:peptidylprolyl isomerase [bacterium]